MSSLKHSATYPPSASCVTSKTISFISHLCFYHLTLELSQNLVWSSTATPVRRRGNGGTTATASYPRRTHEEHEWGHRDDGNGLLSTNHTKLIRCGGNVRRAPRR